MLGVGGWLAGAGTAVSRAYRRPMLCQCPRCAPAGNTLFLAPGMTVSAGGTILSRSGRIDKMCWRCFALIFGKTRCNAIRDCQAAGQLLGMPLQNHIIITIKGYYSFRQHGLV